MSLTDLKNVCHLKLFNARIKLKGGFIVPVYRTVTYILKSICSNLISNMAWNNVSTDFVQ